MTLKPYHVNKTGTDEMDQSQTHTSVYKMQGGRSTKKIQTNSL